jgi:virulence-associated protein VapD
MRKISLLAVLCTMMFSYAQKKPNGTVYINHPAIDVVNAFNKALNDKDINKLDSFFADDFKAYYSVSANQFDKGINKADYVKGLKTWREGLDYFSIANSKDAYPDAIEYKDENQKDVVWVQTWEDVKGVNTKAGVKIDSYLHRLFVINKDNKIKTLFIYDNAQVYDEIDNSIAERTNGTIYNHHDNINNVRNMLYAVEKNDFAKSYTYYSSDARFFDINNADNKPISLEEQKAIDKKIIDAYEIVGLEQVGYPDYMHYEMGDTGVVYSWWIWHLIRKSDKKEIALRMHYQHNMNKEGKITREVAYYSNDVLK